MAAPRSPSPIFALAIFLLFVAFGVEVVRMLLLKDSEFQRPDPATLHPQSFVTLHEKFSRPAGKAAGRQQEVSPQRLAPFKSQPSTGTAPAKPRQAVDIYPHNPATGATRPRATLVIFNDPACAACRLALAPALRAAEAATTDVRVIYKFLPETRQNMDGGIFDQLAWRQNIYPAYAAKLYAASGPFGPDAFVSLLEDAGLDLNRQRELMARDMRLILLDIEKDIAQAEFLGVAQPPAVFLDGYRLGTEALPLTATQLYIAQRLKGMPPGG